MEKLRREYKQSYGYGYGDVGDGESGANTKGGEGVGQVEDEDGDGGSFSEDLMSDYKPASFPLVHVLVETADGSVRALDAINGEQIWRLDTGAPLVTSSIVHQSPPPPPPPPGGTSVGGDASSPESSQASIKQQSHAIVPGADGKLYALSAETAAVMKLGVSAMDIVAATPSMSRDGSTVLGAKKDVVYVIDPVTGMLVNKFSSEDPSSLVNFLRDSKKVSQKMAENIVDQQQQPSSSRQWDFDTMIDDGLVGDHENPLFRPIYLSRTEYSIKSFSAELGAEAWNVSYTKCGHLSGAEALNFLSGYNPGDSGFGDTNDGDGAYFKTVANHLKIRATPDNGLKAFNAISNWLLWSLRLDSMPLSVSLFDVLTGEIKEVSLWEDGNGGDGDEEAGYDGSNKVMMGAHAEGLFVVPPLKGGDSGRNPLQLPAGGKSNQAGESHSE